LDCVIISFFTHLSGEEPKLIELGFNKQQLAAAIGTIVGRVSKPGKVQKTIIKI